MKNIHGRLNRLEHDTAHLEPLVVNVLAFGSSVSATADGRSSCTIIGKSVTQHRREAFETDADFNAAIEHAKREVMR